MLSSCSCMRHVPAHFVGGLLASRKSLRIAAPSAAKLTSTVELGGLSVPALASIASGEIAMKCRAPFWIPEPTALPEWTVTAEEAVPLKMMSSCLQSKLFLRLEKVEGRALLHVLGSDADGLGHGQVNPRIVGVRVLKDGDAGASVRERLRHHVEHLLGAQAPASEGGRAHRRQSRDHLPARTQRRLLPRDLGREEAQVLLPAIPAGVAVHACGLQSAPVEDAEFATAAAPLVVRGPASEESGLGVRGGCTRGVHHLVQPALGHPIGELRLRLAGAFLALRVCRSLDVADPMLLAATVCVGRQRG